MLKKISFTALLLCAVFACATAAEVFKIDSTSVPPANSNVTKTDAGFVFKPDSTWNIPDLTFDGQAGSFEIDLIPDLQPLDTGMKRRMNAVFDLNSPTRSAMVVNQYDNNKKQLLNFTAFNTSQKANVVQSMFSFVSGQEYKIKAEWNSEELVLSVNGKVVSSKKRDGSFKSGKVIRLRLGAIKGTRDSMPMTVKRFVFNNGK